MIRKTDLRNNETKKNWQMNKKNQVGTDWTADPSRSCGRCRTELGRIINRGAVCRYLFPSLVSYFILSFDSYPVLCFSVYVCLLRYFSTTMIVEDYQLKNWPTWHPGGVTSESARTAAISRTGKIGFVPSAEKTSKSTYPRISMRVIPTRLAPPLLPSMIHPICVYKK